MPALQAHRRMDVVTPVVCPYVGLHSYFNLNLNLDFNFLLSVDHMPAYANHCAVYSSVH